MGLRELAFKLDATDAKQMGLGNLEPSQVLAVVTELGYPKAVVTLVTIADGSASLYFSSGGGIVGAGQNPGPAQAAQAVVQEASKYLFAFKKAKDHALPQIGGVRFNILTGEGLFFIEVPEADFHGHHSLTSLYDATQALIAEIRMLDERRRAAQQT